MEQQKIRYDVFESRDGLAFIVWDRQTQRPANADRFHLEADAQIVVDSMNASMHATVNTTLAVAA